MDDVYSILEKHFSYKPQLPINHFFTPGGAVELKVQLVSDIINIVKNKHQLLSKRSSSVKENTQTLEVTTQGEKYVGHYDPHHNYPKSSRGAPHITQEHNLKAQKSVRFLEHYGPPTASEEKIPLREKKVN